MNTKNKNSLSIPNWLDHDKPREKLGQRGKLALTDTELLAIILRTGSAGMNALHIARELLLLADEDLNKLGSMPLEKMTTIKGIGPAKAITITAALELGQRRNEIKTASATRISDSSSAYQLLKFHLSGLQHEEFWIVYLNNAHVVLSTEQLSKGGITGTLVDIRLILKRALELGAVALILAHNHPSGNKKPSPADKKLTRKLTEATRLMDFKVLDHLILTYNDYFSFADAQLL